MQPYPSHLVQRLSLKDDSAVTIRPIRPDDAEIEQQFVRNLSDESRYFRFMDSLRELSPRMLAHLTRVDYELHMALIAVSGRDEQVLQVGVARYVADDARRACEFAIVVADDWQHKGLGMQMMQSLMAAARSAGIRVMYADVLSGNQRMLRLAARLGFRTRIAEDDPRLMRVEVDL